MLALAMLLCADGAVAMPDRIEWQIVDVVEQKTYTVADEASKLIDGGELNASPEGGDLRLTVRYEPGGPIADLPRPDLGGHVAAIRVHLADESQRDRGLVVRLSLVLAGGTWTWMQDLDTPVPLSDQPQSNTAGLRGLPGLPYFTEAERPDYGRYSVYPLGTVEQDGTWLALVRPMDQLAIVRFVGQGGGESRLTAEVDLALSEYTDPPREAEFVLLFARGESRPGRSMRAALRWAHSDFSGVAPPPAAHVLPLGGWMPFADLAKIPDVDEFGFGFQEGAPDPTFDDRLGVRSFIYFHCAGEFANVDGYERGTEPLPPYETVVAAFNEVAKQRTGIENVWDTCGIQDAEGRIAYRPEGTYGDFFCQACVDPDLPYGKAMADRLIQRVTAGEFPEGIDGCYYDGIAAGLDYAREHLRAADHLLLWDGNLRRPVNYNLWSSVEWAAYIHRTLAGTGKMTMLNDSSLSSFPFVGPYIDVPGAEMSIYLQRSTCRLIRALLMSKPFCTLVKADFSQLSQAQIETYMRRCAAYAILFGFFDITPSGANPGSSYWVHPEWYNRDRALFRRYMPIARELLRAEWRPDPLGLVTEGEASLEWFGPMASPPSVNDAAESPEDGLHYATLSTDPRENSEQEQTVTVAVAPRRGESRAEPIAVELLTGRIERDEGELVTQMTGEDLQVWALGNPQAQARACLRRAQDVVQRREAYIEACRSSGQTLTPWGAYGEGGAAIVSPGHDGGHCLAAEKTEPDIMAGAIQTIGVSHDRPRKLIVSAWSKAESVTGARGRNYALYVDCYYTDGSAIYGQTVDFPTGDSDWQYGERTIEPEKPIRNINVYLLFRGGHTGRVYFDDVRVALADDPEANLLKRGGFEPQQAPSLIAGTTGIAARLTEACDSIGRLASIQLDELDWDAAAKTLDDIDAIVSALDWRADRSRRDAEDLRWHVELARACLRGRPQPAQRSSRLTELVALDRPRVSTGPKQYKATTGQLPRGTIVAVDGNFSGYTPTVLTDGEVNPKGAHWTNVAWASGEHADPHWIELRLPRKVGVREIRVWGARDGGALHVPRKLEAQVLRGDEWKPIEGQELEAGGEPGLLVIRLPGGPLRRLRLFQSPHGGSKDRPDLMWISEIELITP